jgi:hypothetical protein
MHTTAPPTLEVLTSPSLDGPKALSLSGVEDALVRAVYDFHFLTAEQVTHLMYSQGSVWYVRLLLRGLYMRGYLHRLRLPSAAPGNTAFVYTLGRRGISYLTGAGIADFHRFRPSEQDEHSYLFLTHTLCLNDCLVAARLLELEEPAVQLVDFVHERTLKRTPVRVTTHRSEHIAVIPDAWLDFHVGHGSHQMAVVFELDRGTVDKKAMKKNLRGLVAYARGPYQASFKTDSLSIALATTAGPHRVELLKNWLEQVLEEATAQSMAGFFLVTALPPGPPSPRELFLSPVWSVPFSPSPVALLEW